MTLNAQQKRFKKINGQPVHLSPVQKALHLPEYKVAGLAAAFNLCAFGGLVSPSATIVGLAASLAGVALGEGWSKFSEYRLNKSSYETDVSKLALDTTPDKLPVEPRRIHDDGAHRYRFFAMPRVYMAGGTMILVAAARGSLSYHGIEPNLSGSNIGPALFGVIGGAASFLGTHFAVAAHAGHKAVNKEWAVVPMPQSEAASKPNTPSGP